MSNAALPDESAPSASLLARVVRHEILMRDGVARVRGRRGVHVGRDTKGALHIRATVVVRYGHAVRSVGQSVQRAAVEAIRRVSGQPVAEVRVAIAGVALSRPTAGQEVRS